MLRRLSGRTHRVHTGVAARRNGEELAEVCSTSVTFVELDPPLIDWYVSTGEPLDKAGAYAVQGLGSRLVAAVDGCFTNVVGLPLTTTRALLVRRGLL
jgi:septum formation protein